MYNLLVGFPDGVALGSRVVEHTEAAVLQYIAPTSGETFTGSASPRLVDPARLVNLPTLVMPETGDRDSRQIARVGHIENLTRSGSNYTFRFVANPAIPEIGTQRMEAEAAFLGINEWEFHRTHWAVKDVDLYRVLHERIIGVRPTPQVFQLPYAQPREPDLVAVMMPFSPQFTPVYQALREAVESMGLRCFRADDIWENHNIMDDVLSLIWRARIVIADLSDKNPNVFYEAGIAHTLGRDVIQIAQSMDDVPFDLRAVRTLTYLNNGEGRLGLKSGVVGRMETLLATR